VKYAEWNGVSWDIEDIENTVGVDVGGSNISLTEINGKPAVTYYVQTWSALRYARKDGAGIWQKKVVYSTGDVGEFSSLVEFGSDPVIFFYDTTNKNLMYAEFNGVNWDAENAVSTGDVGQYCSGMIVLGEPSCAYYDETYTQVRFVRWTGSSWKVERPDFLSSDARGTNLSMATVDGLPGIAYRNDTEDNLMYVPATGNILVSSSSSCSSVSTSSCSCSSCSCSCSSCSCSCSSSSCSSSSS